MMSFIIRGRSSVSFTAMNFWSNDDRIINVNLGDGGTNRLSRNFEGYGTRRLLRRITVNRQLKILRYARRCRHTLGL
jgi:hypothetical protein